MADEVADWFSQHDWIAHLPFRKIINGITPGRGSANDGNTDDEEGLEDVSDEYSYAKEEEEGESLDQDAEGEDIEEQWHDTGDSKSGHPTENEKAEHTQDRHGAAHVVPTLRSQPVKAPNSAARIPSKPTQPNVTAQNTRPKLSPPAARKPGASPPPGSGAKAATGPTVSRRPDVIALMVLGSIYVTLALLCWIAYGTGGKKWYNQTSGTLTTVLAVLGVSFSLLNKISTTRLTTAYRREVGANLLSKRGLTLDSLIAYDRYVNRSAMSILGSKGFRTITIPVGLSIIVASAIMKKSFEVDMMPAPVDSISMPLPGFAMGLAHTILQSDKSTRQRLSNGFNVNDQSSAVSNITISLEFGLYYSDNLFVLQYDVYQFVEKDDHSVVGNYTAYGTPAPTEDTIFGTPALPSAVVESQSNYIEIYLPENPLILARQTPIVEGGLASLDDEEFDFIETSDFVADPHANITSYAATYVYNNTFAVGYYEAHTGNKSIVYNREAAFQLSTGKGQTMIYSSDEADFTASGGLLSPNFHNSTNLSVAASEDNMLKAAKSASDTFQATREAAGVTQIYSANDTVQTDFIQTFLGISATLSLAYMTSYASAEVVAFKAGNADADAVIQKYVSTLIFGRDRYTVVLGMLLFIVGISVYAWAFMSVRKPVGVEFSLITAMSLVANAIDPSTDLSQAISQVQREADRDPLRARPINRRPTTRAGGRTMPPRRPATSAQPAGDPEKAAAASSGIRTAPSRQATGVAQQRRPGARRQPSQRRFNPATMRLGLDAASRLNRLVDDEGGEDDDL